MSSINKKYMIIVMVAIIIYMIYTFVCTQMCFHKINRIEKRIDSIEEYNYNGTCYGDEDCRELERLFEEANNQN